MPESHPFSPYFDLQSPDGAADQEQLPHIRFEYARKVEENFEIPKEFSNFKD